MEIGESLLSHICASYVSYGGFNVEQAGISAEGAKRFGQISWRDAQEQGEEEGILKKMRENQDWSHDRIQEDHDRIMKQRALVDSRAALRIAEAEAAQSEQELAAELALTKVTHIELQSAVKKAHQTVEEVPKRNREIETSLRRFACALGVLPVSQGVEK